MNRIVESALLFAIILTFTSPELARADGDEIRGVTTAEIVEPQGIEYAEGDRYVFAWVDNDDLVASFDATIDFFYAPMNPPAFLPGFAPSDLAGTPIVRGIFVWDTLNAFVWDTSAVPSGAYWIW